MSNDGLRLAVGAPNHSNYMGTTRVYTYDADSDSWIGVGSDIDGLSSNDKQGAAVSLSGDGLTLAIGAPEAGGGTQLRGYARMYKYDETRSRWRQFGNTLNGECKWNSESGLKLIYLGLSYFCRLNTLSHHNIPSTTATSTATAPPIIIYDNSSRH